MDNVAIVVIVERGKADRIVDEAKKVGAEGATIFYARGTGESEFKKFFNLHVESAKEVILFLTQESKKQEIIDKVVEVGRLEEPGVGILFTLPVGELVGLHHRGQIGKE